jgi:CRP-like cAMP-binding protein
VQFDRMDHPVAPEKCQGIRGIAPGAVGESPRRAPLRGESLLDVRERLRNGWSALAATARVFSRSRVGAEARMIGADMAPDSPGSARSDVVESPIDRALSHLLGGDGEAALRWAAAVMRADSSRAVGPLLTGQALAALSRRDVALDVLGLGFDQALAQGNLPMAMVICRELEDQGEDPSGRLDELAKVFAKGSDRLMAAAAKPPSMAPLASEFRPLADALEGEALLEEVTLLVQEARESAAAAKPKRGGPKQVPPQHLFSSLDTSGLRAMLDIFQVVRVPAGEVLVHEGATGAEAYVLARGELEVRRAGSGSEATDVYLARLGGGALFGEMALLSRSPRAASVIALRPSLVLVAHKADLDRIAEKQPQLAVEVAAHCRRRMVENLVRTSAILSAIRPSERPALIERFVARAFETGDVLIAQGQESDGLYLIASGEVDVVHRAEDDSTHIARLGVGEVVGEVALVLRRPATANVTAAMPTVTLHLMRDRFLELIKQHPALLAQLYELAVKREEETSSIVAQEAMDAEELIII